MTTFLTGATGLLGTNLVRLLAQRGESVRVLVRPKSDRRGLAGLQVEETAGDLNDRSALERGMAGADLVVHLAAYAATIPWRAQKMHEVNVEGTARVIEALRASGAGRLVHVSSVAAVGPGTIEKPADEDTPLGPSFGPYWSTKREAERLVMEAATGGLDACVVNPGLVFGPWDLKPSSGSILLRAARGLMRVYPPGTVAVVDAGDVAEGILLAAQKGARGRRYILTGENLRWRELLGIMSDVTGAPRPLAPLPRRPAWLLARLGDRIGRRWPAFSVTFNTNAVAAMFEEGAASSARARAELGWQGRPARAAVERAWAWFRENRPELRAGRGAAGREAAGARLRPEAGA